MIIFQKQGRIAIIFAFICKVQTEYAAELTIPNVIRKNVEERLKMDKFPLSVVGGAR